MREGQVIRALTAVAALVAMTYALTAGARWALLFGWAMLAISTCCSLAALFWRPR